MKIKILVGYNGRVVLAEKPIIDSPQDESIFEAVQEDIFGHELQFDTLKAGIYECLVYWPPHRCASPECVHDDQWIEYEDFKLLCTPID